MCYNGKVERNLPFKVAGSLKGGKMTTENFTLEDEFEDYKVECEAALRTAEAKLINIKEMARRHTSRSPFSSIDYRIKTLESVIDKCERRGYAQNIDSIKKNVHDIAGLRIITPFRDDIYTVVNMLRRVPGFNIDEEKDYVENPKPNGYSSYHLNIQIEVYSPITGGSKLIPIEIQIRDKAMDLWATIEHIVKYKKDLAAPEVSEQFKHIADTLVQFDDLAIKLRDYSSALNLE